MQNRNPALIVCVLLLLLTISSVQAGTIALQWDPVPDATGYYVYYGTSSGQYGNAPVYVPNATEVDLVVPGDCTTYHVAVKAYNGWSESQAFSNEVSGWARPEFGSLDPGEVLQGSQGTLDIVGANFHENAELIIDLDAIPSDKNDIQLLRLENVDVVSCNRIQGLLTVEPTTRGLRAMEVGEFPLVVEVRNPDSIVGAGSVPLQIEVDPRRADVNRDYAATLNKVEEGDHGWWGWANGSTEDGIDHSYYIPDADIDGDGQVDGDDLAHMATPLLGSCWNGTTWSMNGCN